MSLTVTAAGSSGVGNGVFLQVEVLTNATVAGTPAVLQAGGTYNGNITTTQAGSYVLGVMLDWDAPESQTPESGCTQLSAYEDSTNNSTYAAFRTTSATGTPGSTLVGFTYDGGDHDGYGVAACEILSSGGSIGFDASTPAAAANETGTAVTTASFTPPAGSLLVALVSLANGDGADNTPYTASMSDTGGLTWTLRAFYNASVTGDTAYVGVFTAPAPVTSITYNTGATASANNATSVNITIPSGVLTNDVMLMNVTLFTEDSSQPTIGFSGGGGGWTLIPVTTGANPETSAGSGIFVYDFTYYRVATAGDPGATLTISETGSPSGTTWWSVALASYTGASTSAPVDVAGGASAQGTNAQATCPSETTATSGDWAIYLGGGGLTGGGATMSGPAGTTQRQNISSSAGIGSGIFDSNGSVGAAGTSIGGGKFSSSGSGTTWLTAFTLGLAPAGGATSPNGTVQPLVTAPISRRRSARAVIARILGPANAHGPSAVSSGWSVTRRRPAGAFFGGIASTVVAATLAAAPVTGGHVYQRAQPPHRAVTAHVAGPANAHGPSGTVQRRATVPVPRRTAARGAWAHVTGPANAHGGNGKVQPRAAVAVPRRTAARAVTRYVTGPANAYGPSAVSSGWSITRRQPVGGFAGGISGPVPVSSTGPAGTVQPRATVPVPRRTPARAAWARILGTVNAHGPSGTVQPRTALEVGRRTSVRAVWAHITGTVSTTPHPSGTVQPKPTAPEHRRTAARAGQWARITAPFPPPAGTVQPRAVIPVPRRTAVRALIAHVTAPFPPPSGAVQPRAAVAVPRRGTARVTWHGNAVPGSRPQAATGGLVRRRTAARVLWHGIAGPPPAPVITGTPATGGRVPRRPGLPARVLWHGAAGPANAHGGTGTIQPHIPVPRRTAARAAWHGYAATGIIPPVITARFTAGQARSAWSAGEARSAWEAGAVAAYSQSVLSLQYVQVPVTAFGTAGTYNPTGDSVQFSFTPANYPVTEPSVWVAGSWATFPGPAYWAQCLVGPGGATALTIGTYQLWLKITDSPEVPVLQPTLLTITP